MMNKCQFHVEVSPPRRKIDIRYCGIKRLDVFYVKITPRIKCANQTWNTR